jgi:hypothetical protein
MYELNWKQMALLQQGRKEGRKGGRKERREEGKKEGREEERKETRKKTRKEGRKTMKKMSSRLLRFCPEKEDYWTGDTRPLQFVERKGFVTNMS